MLVAPARLGLTATPPSPLEGDGGHALASHVGPTVYALRVEELAGGELADFGHDTITVELDARERGQYLAFRGQFNAFYAARKRENPGMSWRELVRISQRSDNGRDALAAWRASRAILSYPAGKRAALRAILERHAADRVLVFTGDNATAYAIARELLVMPITCDIGKSERAAMLDRFRSGAISVLVSSQVLDEGFDLPDADVAVIAGGTSSERRQVQRVGRVLRPRPGKRALVYELVVRDTVEVRQVLRRQRALARAATPAEVSQ
jgi:superfamily II DNA or RNA helicase